MFARLHIARPFFYLGQSGISDLEFKLYSIDGTLITTLYATESVGLPKVYYTEEHTFEDDEEGTYLVNWVSIEGSIDIWDRLYVSEDPIADLGVGVTEYPIYEDDTGKTVEVKVYDANLDVIDGSPFSCTEFMAGKYKPEDGIVFEEIGPYILEWFNGSDYVYEEKDAYKTDGEYLARIIVKDAAGWELADVDVLLCTADGNPYKMLSTDKLGRAYFTVPAADYFVLLRKSGRVFKDNIFSLTVTDYLLQIPNENKLVFEVDYLDVAFPEDVGAATSSLSKMKVYVVDLSGAPKKNINIMIRGLYSPFSTGEYMVHGDKTMETNFNGYAEITLIRGQKVEVSIGGTPIHRTITVPDSSEFNLASVISEDGDPFTSVQFVPVPAIKVDI